jgi:hypothetical protein
MGWFYEEHAAHGGYVVGFVARDGCAADAGLYRELGYPRDDGTRQVECLSAGCDCGWRSPRWAPQRPARWSPFSVAVCEPMRCAARPAHGDDHAEQSEVATLSLSSCAPPARMRWRPYDDDSA